MAEPRSLEQLAAELARVEAEVTRLRREVAAAMASAAPAAAPAVDVDEPRRPLEVTETDRAAARAAARRLGLVVRERGGRQR